MPAWTEPDGVFAIALTLLVLTIEVPDVNGNLGHELARLWPAYRAYGLSVLVMFGFVTVVTWDYARRRGLV